MFYFILFLFTYSFLLLKVFIWGRGTLDCKGILLGILEAVENLLSEGFTLQRTVYFAFGHDEEIEGKDGARVIAKTLLSRGVKLEFVLDEGLTVILGNVFPGTEYLHIYITYTHITHVHMPPQ